MTVDLSEVLDDLYDSILLGSYLSDFAGFSSIELEVDYQPSSSQMQDPYIGTLASMI
jgi:hypothetical protein